jgi:hypothetical protein
MSRIPQPETPSYVLALFLQSSATRVGLDSWLPNTATGWITTIGFLGLLGKEIWKRGQKEAVSEETINGMGARIEAVERSNSQLVGQFQEHQRTVDRILASNEKLLVEIGHAEKGAAQCREDTEKYTLEIGSKVDTLRREILAELREAREELSNRTGNMEVKVGELATEVRLRAEFDARDNQRER